MLRKELLKMSTSPSIPLQCRRGTLKAWRERSKKRTSLNAQQMGCESWQMENTLQQKRQSDRDLFEEFKREEAEWRREPRKKPRKQDKGKREYRAPPPSRFKDTQWTTCLKNDSVVNLKLSDLKKKHRQLVLKHHPNEHEAKDQTEQTALVRAIQEADELVKETVFARD